MAVQMQCPHCQVSLSAPDHLVGHVLRCKKCGKNFPGTPAPASGDESKLARETHLPKLEAATVDAKDPRATGGHGLAPAAKSLMPKEIGGFAVHRLLGEGAFGLVYLGFDSKLDRWVALKVPHAHTLNSPRARQRFEREAKATAQLRHPHIVPVFAAGFDGKHHFLASQFIAGLGATTDKEPPRGLTLDDAIKKKRLDDRQAARIVHDLAEALHYAHSVGIVHRDVKPANVMVDEQMGVHLGDFGLAHLQDSVEKITQDGTIMGTPAYMAPELAKGAHGDVMPAGDQYSLGILMYELLCGKVPFSGPVGAVLALHVSQEPPSPSGVRADLPKDLETICLKALAKRPEDRYADCQALADDLRRWLEGEPIQARRLSPTERLVRWTRKNPLVAGLAASIFVVLVVGISISTGLAAFAIQRSADLAIAINRAEQNAEDARKHADDAQKNLEKAKENLDLANTKETEARTNLALAKKNESDAKSNLDLARKNETEAKANLDLAKKNEAEAKTQEEAAKQNAEKFERVLLPKYEADLSVAQSYWEQKEPQKAVKYLEGLRPDNLGGKDYRGFEWYYLSKAYGLPVETTKIKGVTGFGLTGKYLAIAQENVIQVWDAETRQILHSFKTEDRKFYSLIVSSDGALVASVASLKSGDRVDVWESRTGQLLSSFKGKARAFSPDNEFITGYLAGRHTTWDLKGTEFLHFQDKDVIRSPDGKTGVTPGRDGVIHVLETGKGKSLRTLEPPDTDPNMSSFAARLVFSANGKRLAVQYLLDQKKAKDQTKTERSHAIQVWDLKSGQRLCLIPLGKYTNNYVYHLALSSDGEELIAAFENEARVWNVKTQKLLRTIDIKVALNFAGLTSVMDGKRLLSVRNDRGQLTIREWDLNPDSLVHHFKDSNSRYHNGLVFSPDGKSLACGTESGAIVWNLESGKPPRRFDAKALVSTLAFSPDGKLLAIEASPNVHVWDTQSGQLVHSLSALPARKAVSSAGGHAIGSLAFSHDSTRLACGCCDGSFLIWAIPSGTELHSREGEKKPGHHQWRTSVAFTAEGRCLASWFSGSLASMLNVCDLQTGQMLLANVKIGTNYKAVFSSDGRQLASFHTSEDGPIRKWDMRTGQPLQDLKCPPGSRYIMAFSPDGTRLAFGRGMSVQIWNTQSDQLLLSFEENSPLQGIAFSPDGKKLAISLSGNVRSADGKSLVQSYKSGSVKVWDASR